MNLCSICIKHVKTNCIFCDICKLWVHKNCANLSTAQLSNISNTDEDWYCQKCLNDTFPFSSLTNEDITNNITNEFPFNNISGDLPLGIDDNLADLYDNCSSLNFEPFTFTNNKGYFMTDNADPDDNFYKHMSTNSLYYTEEQFKHKFAGSKEESTNFSIIHLNCRSLPSNYNKLKDCINALDFQFDVIALSENWLIDNDTDSFNIDGYKMFTCSRTNKSGGGVALYINDSLQHKYLPDMSKCLDNCAEVVSLEIALKNGKKALICCIYRAPKTDLEQLNEFISNFCRNTRNKTVYLCGDFNIDLLQHDTNTSTNNFIDHLYSFGLHPLITRPTRITGHSKTLIDNIFTTNLSNIHSGLIINDLSDHLPILLIFEYKHNNSTNVIYNTKRIVNDHNINVMMHKFKETNWNEILASEDVNYMYDTFTAMLRNIYNTTCPVTVTKQKLVRKIPDKPWMTNSLKQACKKKNLLYRQFLKKRSVASEERYKRYKNKLTGILRYCEKNPLYRSSRKKQRKH